ncbi:MAG: hypothetical protein JSS27_06715 [Planctomycetes bacterium]|nr:hypothetical protein [Planctomycetota bacterium]
MPRQGICLTLLLLLAPAGWVAAADAGHEGRTVRQLNWMADYGDAMELAQKHSKMLLVQFYGTDENTVRDQFENQALDQDDIGEKLADYVLVRVPADATITAGGKEVNLLDHESFQDLHGKEGLAIIDYVHVDAQYYDRVVNVFPLVAGKFYRYEPSHLSVILDLPPGTLTQRTMVFAVRIHPEAPASTQGQWCNVLRDEATSHSDHQAEIRVQGHHNWGSRFQRILGRMPSGLRAQEVVAESWPHESLVDAAVDCVGCWRQSPGHWSAVRASQPRFGYDMRRGTNGIWYATGLFGNRH